MNPLINFFVQRPLLVYLSLFGIVALGIYSLRTSVFSAYPNFTFGTFAIVTHSPGASPNDVELNITTVLEEELLEVDRIKQLRSSSMTGISSVLVQAADSATRKDLDEMTDALQRAIDRAADRLPAHLPRPPELTELKPVLEPVIELRITGNVSEAQLRAVADIAQDELRELDGVAGIDKRSYRNAEVRILLDPIAMHRLGLTVEEIEHAIRARNVTASGGVVQSVSAEKNVIAVGRFAHPKDVAKVIIRAPAYGNLVRVEDVAEVVADYEDWSVRSYYNGQPGIYLGVRRAQHADELTIVDQVKRKVEELNLRLPLGVELNVTNDLSRFTRAMLTTLAHNGVAGMLLVSLVMLAFYPWRATLWIVAGIPTTILLSITLMPLLGLTEISQFTLAAIILMMGLLVDDAVVTSESILRRFENGQPAQLAAIDGTAAIAPAVITGTTTTVLAFAPLVFLDGQEGRFMWMLPAMVLLLITASLLECKLMLPAHMAHALRRCPQQRASARWFDRLEALYRNQIAALISRRYWSLAGLAILLIAMAVVGLQQVTINLYPDSGMDRIHVRATLPPGSSADHSYRELRKVERLIHRIIDERDLQNTRLSVGTHDIGRPDEVSPVHQNSLGTIDIMLEPLGVRQVDVIELTHKLRAALARFTQFQSLRVKARDLGPPTGHAIELEIVGNTAQRVQVAEELLAFVRAQNGVTDAWTSYLAGKDNINLQLNHEAIAAHGLSVSAITRALQVAFDGYIIGELQTLDERIRYRLQLQEPQRGDTATLHSLTVTNRAGDTIPLRALADFVIEPGQAAISHYFGKRSETVYAEIDRERVSLAEINARVATFLHQQHYERRYPGLRVKQHGEWQSQQATTARMGGALLLSVSAIFCVMALLFNSLSQPLIVVSVIPMGFIGVLLAFAAHGQDLSVPAMIGTLGLAGVLVNGAVVMIDHLNRCHAQQDRMDPEQIAAAASARLRPLLITSLTSVVGLAPAAYGWLGSNPFLTPMIMAMLWGIAFGSVLTLFYLPCFYAIDLDCRRLLARRSRRRPAAPQLSPETQDADPPLPGQ